MRCGVTARRDSDWASCWASRPDVPTDLGPLLQLWACLSPEKQLLALRLIEAISEEGA